MTRRLAVVTARCDGVMPSSIDVEQLGETQWIYLVFLPSQNLVW